MHNITFLDLFAGCGGLSEGFIRQGFEVAAHVEMDKAACHTIKTRQAYHWLVTHSLESCYKKYQAGIITRRELYRAVPSNLIESVINAEISGSSISRIFGKISKILGNNKLNVIVGGPPCQAYSLAGRSRDKDKMINDPRNHLYVYYAMFLKYYKPDIFVFENVPGLLSAKDSVGSGYLDSMISLFRETGYSTEFQILNASDYCVPQERKRVILIGRRGKLKGFYPDIVKKPWDGNVHQVLRDLPPLKAGGGSWRVENESYPLTHHIARNNSPRDLEIYRIIADGWNKCGSRISYSELPEHLQAHKNKAGFRDRFKVVASDAKSSHTIVAHISKDGNYYIHPDVSQNRSITPREAARLQSFPDDYFFESVSESPSFSTSFRQMGNAVPVKLSEAIASSIKCFL